MKHSISKSALPLESFIAVNKLISTHEQLFSKYIDQLLWWNKRINLISRNVSRETIWNHVIHSLLLTQIPSFHEEKVIIDAGTGGGLPGVPLAISAPDHFIFLNDIVSKKVMADKQIVRTLGLKNVKTTGGSVGSISIDTPFLLVSKHAFKISDLHHMTRKLRWNRMIFYKGADFEDEISEIETPLTIKIIDLFKNSDDNFYRDKAIIEVSR